MRNLILIFVLLLSTSCCSFGVRPTEEAADCPWQLVGSGTLVPIYTHKDTIIFLTAAHVADNEGELIAVHRDGRLLLKGKVLEVHPVFDAALIEFTDDQETVQTAQINFQPLKYGEHVTVPGYQAGSIWIVDGIASDPYSCSTPMYYGGSGSPVLDDQGYVRAIVIAVARYNGRVVFHHCYILPLFEIEGWMETCLGSQLN